MTTEAERYARAQETAMKNMGDNATADINNYMDLWQAHSTMHPDRGQCGGVGRCLMMRTECEAEDGFEALLQHAADEGMRVTVTFHRAAPAGK